MSLYQFIATDKPLEKFSIGITEIRPGVIVIEDEFRTLNIFTDEKCHYSEIYTKLPYIMGVEIGPDYNRISNELFEYIKDSAIRCKTMECFSTWLDEEDKKIEKKAVDIKDLNPKYVEWVFGNEFYDHPMCLKIYNNKIK